MILHKATFGPVPKTKRSEAEDAVEGYISTLFNNGQTCGEYFLVVQDGKLCAYVHLQGIRALSRKYCSKYTFHHLDRVVAHFGGTPEWELIDDEAPKRDTTWSNAPFLYLYTDQWDWDSPLRRGDNGKPVPIYRLPGTSEHSDGIPFWQSAYREYDAIWMNCGELEIPVYKQLATPNSELSGMGRGICRDVEKATGVPTYYFLMRHWGRRKNEEKRKCPGCGQPWRTPHPIDIKAKFWQFPFKCDRCRIVSNFAYADDDERHAVIGEWKNKVKKKRRKPSTPAK
jgi:predicted  nucleic acid-binding Zn ribbon protein